VDEIVVLVIQSLGSEQPVDTAKVAQVADRVIDVVADQFGQPKEQIKFNTHFVNDLGADSLDVTELVMELEEEFDIHIPDDAAEKIQTVGQAIEHIVQAVSKEQNG
jgi:acyl carrier protein